MVAFSPLLAALLLSPPSAYATNRCDAGDQSQCAPAAAPAPSDEDMAGCQKNKECLDTYAAHRKLATAQWNEQAYADFVQRYGQITGGYVSEDKKKVKGKGGPAPTPLTRISTDAKDWQSRYTEFGGGEISGGDCHVKAGDSWNYINQMVACEMGVLVKGRQQTEKWFAEIQAVKNRKLFQEMVTRKVDHIFPSPMGDKKFAVADVVYVYLGHDARKFISDKWDSLDAACKGKSGSLGSMMANANPDKKDVCKGDLSQDKEKFNNDLKQVSKELKNQPTAVFDKSGQFASLDAADSVGGVKLAAAVVAPRVMTPANPTPNPTTPPVDQKMVANKENLKIMQSQVLSSLGELGAQETKLLALQQDDKVRAALADVGTAKTALTKVKQDLEAALQNPSDQAVAAISAEYASADQSAKKALAEATPLTARPAVDNVVSEPAKKALAELSQYKGNLSGKEAKSRLFDPRTVKLDQAYAALKGQPLQGDAKEQAAVVAELTRRVKANCGKPGLPWKQMGDFLNDNPALQSCAPAAGGGGGGVGEAGKDKKPGVVSDDLSHYKTAVDGDESVTPQDGYSEIGIEGSKGFWFGAKWQGGGGFLQLMNNDNGPTTVVSKNIHAPNTYTIWKGQVFEYKRQDQPRFIVKALADLDIPASQITSLDIKGLVKQGKLQKISEQASSTDAVQVVYKSSDGKEWGDEWKDPVTRKVRKADWYGQGRNLEVVNFDAGHSLEPAENKRYNVPAGTVVKFQTSDKAAPECYVAGDSAHIGRGGMFGGNGGPDGDFKGFSENFTPTGCPGQAN